MREGVNKVALRLFEHNEKAYHAAVRMMEQYGKALRQATQNSGIQFRIHSMKCLLTEHLKVSQRTGDLRRAYA